MKIKNYVLPSLILFSLITFTLVFFGCGGDNVDLPEFDDDILLYTKWPFPLGVAVPGARTSNSGSNDNALLANNPQFNFLGHFNVYVAENEMKPNNILPASKPSIPPGQWNHTDPFFTWTHADALVNYAQANGRRIRGHTLIWHDQTPNWFFQGSGAGGRASIDELYANMENYIRVVFQKYGGIIDTWDVVNEVVSHNTNGPRTDSEGSMYFSIMKDAGKTGMDQYEYAAKAFEWARRYADENGGEDVKLYLTDFGIERPFYRGSPPTSKQADFEDLADWLISVDAPIDGVGFQGHFRLYDHPVEEISAGIDLFASKQRGNGTNIMVQVCELDFSIFSNAKGEGSSTRISSNLLNERLTDLAQTYLDFFEMFEQKFNEGKLDMVLIWGIADGHSWLNNHPVRGRQDHPLLFNRNYRAKQAYRLLVHNRPDFHQ